MSANPPDLRLARFIKFWRQVHSISQEELAHRLGSSPRHISRLENGSSRPSEAMVEDLARAFILGEGNRNHLRVAAGLSPKFRKMDFHSPELKWLRKAMRLTLRALDPYPTALSDGFNNILMVNRGWVGLYQRVIPIEQLHKVSNLFEFMFSEQFGGSVVSAWEDTLSVILMTLKQSAMLTENQEETEALEKYLKNPNVPADWLQRGSRLEAMASFRMQVEYEGVMRGFYSVIQMVNTFGPAAYVAEPRLYINTLYPEDESLDLSSLLDGELTHPLLFY